MADQMAREFMEWMGDRECESLEEMQEAMDRFNREMNAAQLDEFCGLVTMPGCLTGSRFSGGSLKKILKGTGFLLETL